MWPACTCLATWSVRVGLYNQPYTFPKKLWGLHMGLRAWALNSSPLQTFMVLTDVCGNIILHLQKQGLFSAFTDLNLWNALDLLYHIAGSSILIYRGSQFLLPLNTNGIFQYPWSKSLLQNSMSNTDLFRDYLLTIRQLCWLSERLVSKINIIWKSSGMASVLESKECGFHKFHSLVRCHRTSKFDL